MNSTPSGVTMGSAPNVPAALHLTGRPVTWPEVLRIIPVSRSTSDDGLKSGMCPKCVRISTRGFAWYGSNILALAASWWTGRDRHARAPRRSRCSLRSVQQADPRMHDRVRRRRPQGVGPLQRGVQVNWAADPQMCACLRHRTAGGLRGAHRARSRRQEIHVAGAARKVAPTMCRPSQREWARA